MADKIINTVKKTRGEMWSAFKVGLQIKGYKYYEAPAAIKYRYPAPGSCSMDVADHPNLYKNDWKTPFRTSDFNIAKIEVSYRDDDPEQAENYISKLPVLDASHPVRGKYDQALIDEAIPAVKQTVLFEEHLDNLCGEEMRDQLWGVWDSQEADMKEMRHDYGPGQHDYYDDYNQQQLSWQNRGVTGFENSPRMKEMFVELEYWIEEVIGKAQMVQGKVDAYKGQPKKWQILDDACFSRDQIELLQQAADAPMPEQLEMWKEKHNKPIFAPYNNANVAKWRDDARALDSADFDPQMLVQSKEQKRRLFLERYEKPKELTE